MLSNAPLVVDLLSVRDRRQLVMDKTFSKQTQNRVPAVASRGSE